MSHVVLVTRIYAPEPAAASFRLEAMVGALAAAGHDVTVLTTRPRPGSTTPASPLPTPAPASPSAPGGGRVRVQRAAVLRNREGYVRGYVQYLSFDLPAALRLLTVRRPDVVVVEPPPTTGVVVRVIAALRRVPYIYYAADLWSDAVVSDTGRGLVARVLARVEGWAMRGARGVIAVLPSVAERVRELTNRPAGGLRELEVRVVGHGIDTDVFRPAQPDESAPDGAPRNFLVYAGTTSSWHGADIFIRALAQVREQIPDLELVYLGHGSQWAQLQELARETVPGAVHFHPVLPPDQAAQWLRAATGAIVSLKPGQNYDLAFPTKLYAALACGTPAVFAGVGPAFPVVADNNLGYAAAYDVGLVADAMVALARDAQLPAAERVFVPARLAGWVAANASLKRVGAHAATLIENWADSSTK